MFKMKHRLTSIVLSLVLFITSFIILDEPLQVRAAGDWDAGGLQFSSSGSDFKTHINFSFDLVGQYESGWIVSVIDKNGKPYKGTSPTYVNWGNAVSRAMFDSKFIKSRFGTVAITNKYCKEGAIKDAISHMPAPFNNSGGSTVSEVKSVLEKSAPSSASSAAENNAALLVEQVFNQDVLAAFKDEELYLTLESVCGVTFQTGPFYGCKRLVTSYGFTNAVSSYNGEYEAWKRAANSSSVIKQKLDKMSNNIKQVAHDAGFTSGGLSADDWGKMAVDALTKSTGKWNTSTGVLEHIGDAESSKQDMSWVLCRGIHANYLNDTNADEWGTYLANLAVDSIGGSTVRLSTARSKGTGCIAYKLGDSVPVAKIHTKDPKLSTEQQKQPHNAETPKADKNTTGDIDIFKIYVEEVTQGSSKTYTTKKKFHQPGCCNKVVIENEPGAYKLKRWVVVSDGYPLNEYQKIMDASASPSGTTAKTIDVPDGKDLVCLYVKQENVPEDPPEIPVTSDAYNFILYENQLTRVVKLSASGTDKNGVDKNNVALQMTKLSGNNIDMSKLPTTKFNFTSPAHTYSGSGKKYVSSHSWYHHYSCTYTVPVPDKEFDSESGLWVVVGSHDEDKTHFPSKLAGSTSVSATLFFKDKFGDLSVAGKATGTEKNPIVTEFDNSSLTIYTNWNREASAPYGVADQPKDKTGYDACVMIWRSDEANKIKLINYRTDEAVRDSVLNLFGNGVQSTREQGIKTTAVPYRTEYNAKFNWNTDNTLANARSKQNQTEYTAKHWYWQSNDCGGEKISLNYTDCSNHTDISFSCHENRISHMYTDGTWTVGPINSLQSYTPTSSVVYTGIKVHVESYAGIPDSDLNKVTDNNKGKISAGSIQFIPYYYMYYQKVYNKDDIANSSISDGKTQNTIIADTIVSGTQSRFRSAGTSKGASSLAAVAGNYKRQLYLKHDATVWYDYSNLCNLSLHSNEWMTQSQAITDWGTNSVLQGGAAIEIKSGNNTQSSPNLNNNLQIVHVKTWDCLLMGDALKQVLASGSNNGMETTPDVSIAKHDSLAQETQDKIDAASIQMWVTPVAQNLIGTSNDAKPFETGQPVYFGTGHSSSLKSYTNSDYCSEDSKYYLDQTPVTGGPSNKHQSGTLDLVQSNKTTKFYTVYTRNGQIYIDDTTSNPGVLNFSNSGAGMASELDAHTGVITQMKSNIQLKGGLDMEKQEWYHEIFDGITIIVQETTSLWDVHGPVERQHVIDPKLTPSQGEQGKNSMFSRYTAAAYRVNLNESEGFNNWRTPFQTKGSDQGWWMLFHSNVFYIPASTVQDNY